MITLIVAASNNNAIGKEGEMLWHLPNDLKFFKNMTWGMPVIMGRKTFDSLGKALAGRTNIVITSQKDWTAEGVEIAHDLDSALLIAEETNAKEIFIAGGGEIYKQAMPIADKIYMTRVIANLDADTFFPTINKDEWEMTEEEKKNADEKHNFDYSFRTWVRKAESED